MDMADTEICYYKDSDSRLYTKIRNIVYENEFGTDNMYPMSRFEREGQVLTEIGLESFLVLKKRRETSLMGILQKSIDIATKAHKGQVDKAGKDYIEHPKEVAARCKGLDTKIVAMLHDVIEDTDLAAQDLVRSEIPDYLVDAVTLLTKVKDENYSEDEYYRKIKKNRIARVVKLADLSHNTDLSRLEQVDEKAMKRYKKYLSRIAYLNEN